MTTKIAVHESGHALAAFVLGVAIRSVSIRPKQNHLGVTRLDATGEERLCDAAVVFACGPMSTRIAEGKASE